MVNTNETKKRIGNVACLDLRTATAETFEAIERIDNAAVVIHSPQTAEMVARMNLMNAAVVVEAPADARMIMGQERIGSAMLTDTERAIDIIVVGQLMFGPDVTPELINERIATITITGQILYPDTVEGAVQSKIKHITGQSIPYPLGVEVTIGSLKLTEQTLSALKDDSSLFVVGKLSAPNILPNELINQKIREFAVIGSVLCREENSETLLGYMQNSVMAPTVSIIPTGYEWIPGKLALDSTLLAVMQTRKLYCSDLSIDKNVTVEELEQQLDHIIVTNLLIAPQILSGVLATKCNLLSTSHVFYAGDLWQFDDEDVLDKERFDYLDGKATIVVTGELAIGEDIEPKVLAQRIEKIHNFGEITCTPAQRSALQSRMGRDEGEFAIGIDDIALQGGIVNTAYLKL